MKNRGGSKEAKRRAGRSAADQVEDGDVVGLGTGSTAAYAVERLAERVDAGLDVEGVPTSSATRRLAIQEGVPLTSLDVETPDLAIDGADAYTSDLDLVKGGGAAHTREKVVAEASESFLVVVDPSKEVEAFEAVPLEVLEHALPLVMETVEELGGETLPRKCDGKDGWVVSDDGNPVLDADFDRIDDPRELSRALDGVTGVVEHGLFVDMADEVHVGEDEGVTVLNR